MGRCVLGARNSSALVGLVLALLVSGCSSSHHHTASVATTTTSSAPTTTAAPSTTTTLAGPPGGPVPSGFEPQSVTFVSGSLGWVLGAAPCSAGLCTAVVRTEDGGQTWSSIPAPSAGVGTGAGQIDEIRFADPLDGWAYGSGALEVTHDGGARWSSVAVPGASASSLESLEAGGGHVYALVLAGSGATPAGASVYESPVGADTWTLQPGSSVAQAVSGRLVVEAGMAWMVVHPSDGSTVFRADVSGRWVSRSLPCQESGGEVLAAANASDLAVICAQGAAAGSQPKLPYLSTDAGVSWQPAANAPLGGDTIGAAMAGPGTIVISAASGASWLYASFDGGQTWSTVEQDNTSGGEPWEDLGFTTPTQGVVVEGIVRSSGSGVPPAPKLFITRDGGHSWAAVSF